MACGCGALLCVNCVRGSCAMRRCENFVLTCSWHAGLAEELDQTSCETNCNLPVLFPVVCPSGWRSETPLKRFRHPGAVQSASRRSCGALCRGWTPAASDRLYVVAGAVAKASKWSGGTAARVAAGSRHLFVLVISRHSFHTTRHTPFMSHYSPHTTHVTPLNPYQSFHTTHTNLILNWKTQDFLFFGLGVARS